jgi:hypothetical protein
MPRSRFSFFLAFANRNNLAVFTPLSYKRL